MFPYLIAVLLASFAGFFVNWIWYSATFFGKSWEKLVGFPKVKKSALKHERLKAYSWSFLMDFLAAFVLAYFIGFMQLSTLYEVVQLVFWVWLGFVVTTQGNGVIFEQHPIKLYLIKVSHYFVSFVVMGVVLLQWI